MHKWAEMHVLKMVMWTTSIEKEKQPIANKENEPIEPNFLECYRLK